MQLLNATKHSSIEEVKCLNYKTSSRLYLGLVGLGIDVCQLLVDGHRLTELQSTFKHFL